MRLDSIRAGNHPPDDINVIAEVPVGGEPKGLSLLDVNSRISERAFFRVDLAAAPTRALITSSLMRINCWQQPRAEDCLEHC